MIENGDKSKLYGKRILFVGDSICEAFCEASDAEAADQAGWSGRIGKNTGAITVNRSRGGASLSNVRRENTVANQLFKEADSGCRYDFVILHGGVNDGWDEVSPGKVAATDNEEDFDISTYAGGFEKTIATAVKCFPGAKLGYIINEKTPNPSAGKLADMSEYWNIGKLICKKYGIPFIDLYSIDEISAVPTCNGDHIHPNPQGYDMITPYIQDWLEGLVE